MHGNCIGNFRIQIGSCLYMFCYLVIVLMVCGRKVREELNQVTKKDDHDEKLLEKYVKLMKHNIRPRPTARPRIAEKTL